MPKAFGFLSSFRPGLRALQRKNGSFEIDKLNDTEPKIWQIKRSYHPSFLSIIRSVRSRDMSRDRFREKRKNPKI